MHIKMMLKNFAVLMSAVIKRVECHELLNFLICAFMIILYKEIKKKAEAIDPATG